MPGKSPRKSYTLSEIKELYGGDIVGDPGTRISRAASIKSATKGDIVFLADDRWRTEFESTKASAVILNQKNSRLTQLPTILSCNPYLYFAKVSSLFNPLKVVQPGVSDKAYVSESAKIADSVTIGPGVFIGADAVIEGHTNIEAGSYIGNGVKVGRDTAISPNTTIYDGCSVGNNSVIHSGVVVGADGFGFARDDKKKWVKIPQVGRVIIGNNCEIGANSTIDRGALDDTVICSGVKLDNQIQVGHNCFIGEDTAIAGRVAIAGSVVIGRRCQIGGGTLISGHLKIGDDVVVSGGTFVAKSLIGPGRYTGVFPTDDHTTWKKNASLIRGLRKMLEKIKALEKKIGLS